MSPNDNCQWQPIDTAPVGSYILITDGGPPGVATVAVAKLRPVAGKNELQILGFQGAMSQPQFWMPYQIPTALAA